MFGDVVLDIEHHLFEEKLTALKKARNVQFDVQLTAEDLKSLISQYKQVYIDQGKYLPQDPWVQLRMGVEAVFKSWNIPRAVKYREINKISGLKGTAVNIQTMVYGNVNDRSGTGVCFTRNPATGQKELFGEYLANAQVRPNRGTYLQPAPFCIQGDGPNVCYIQLFCTPDVH